MTDTEITRQMAPNQSTIKALDIIEFLARQSKPTGIQAISVGTGINISTVHRFLATLEHRGYVLKDSDNGRYELTMKICNVAYNVAANNSIRQVAEPYLKKLSVQYGVPVCLSIEQNMRVIYIDSYERDQLLKSFTYIGKTAPMHCTGVGKLFLSRYSDEQLENYIQVMGLPAITPNTKTTVQALKEEFSFIESNGYSMDMEECELGVCCVAVPVMDYTNQIIAGISLTGASGQMKHKVFDGDIQTLIDACAEVSKLMGYHAS